MKHLKFKEYSKHDVEYDITIKKVKNDIIGSIGDDWSEDDEKYFKGCPFVDEILLLHQRDYIDSIYNDSGVEWEVSLGKFREIYKEMLVDATKKILSDLEKNPELYSRYGENIESYGIKVPDEISKNIPKEDLLNKFNL